MKNELSYWRLGVGIIWYSYLNNLLCMLSSSYTKNKQNAVAKYFCATNLNYPFEK